MESLSDCLPGWEGVLKKVAHVQAESQRRKMVTGNDFTPFVDAIKIDENMSSRILRLLLDPEGNHGQKGFFQQIFFEVFTVPQLRLEFKNKACRPFNEKRTVGHGKRRIDIVLETEDFMLGIENKIKAYDQPAQLSAYLHWMAYKCPHKNYYLVYLTPLGQEPSLYTLPDPEHPACKNHYFRMSWKDLCRALLKSTTCIPTRIAYFINEFCSAILSQIVKESTMEDYTNVINCIARKTSTDQLKAAYAIHKSYELAVDLIIQDWIKSLQTELEGRVRGKILLNQEYSAFPSEFGYLEIAYSDMKISVYILLEKRGFFSEASNTVIWGVGIWPAAISEIETMFSNPWINFIVQEKFEIKELSGLMIYYDACGIKDSPTFLEKILNNTEKPYLYENILHLCQRLENYHMEYVSKNPGPLFPKEQDKQ